MIYQRQEMNISRQLAILQNFLMEMSTADWKLTGQIILNIFFYQKCWKLDFCCARSICLFSTSICLFRNGFGVVKQSSERCLIVIGLTLDKWMTSGSAKSFILDIVLGCIQRPDQPNPVVWNGASCENS